MSHKQPIKPISHDGVYPRCVWCGTELYAPAVSAYSRGGADCHKCGKSLPDEYIKLVDMFGEHEDKGPGATHHKDDNCEGTDDHPDVTDERS